MKPFFAFWITAGLAVCYLHLADDFPTRGTFGEFGRIAITFCCLPGIIMLGMVPYAAWSFIAKKIR